MKSELSCAIFLLLLGFRLELLIPYFESLRKQKNLRTKMLTGFVFD
jgi:hypothetical protein